MLWLLVNIRFQVLFHSPPGVLFTFPSRYCFTIGHQVVFRLGGWSPLLPTGFHVSGGTLDSARYLKISFTGLLPSLACRPRQFYYLSVILNAVRNPESITTFGLASSRFARRYFGNLFWFLFLRLLRCFSSAGLPTYTYFIQYRLTRYCLAGFPHSEICGSTLICSYPQLIAAYHVLLRLLMPRHSSYALLSLTFSLTISRSPALNYVSKSFAFFSVIWYLSRFRSFYSYPFLFEKTFSVFLLFLLFSFQTTSFKHLLMFEKYTVKKGFW